MAFEQLKARQGEVWGAGDFAKVAETLADVHDALVDRLDPQPGERWLDIASGTGGVAERAAARGADVTGIDLAPALVETARRRAEERGLAIRYAVGDAERLDVPDASFDVASSSFGLIFAPAQAAAAAELARVVRPGGRMGLANWTQVGAIGGFFRMLSPFQPPPPEGAGNPMAWGDEAHVESLLGDAFELSFEPLVSTYRAASPQAAWDDFTENFGPMKATVASLEPDRLDELHAAWLAYFEQYRDDDGVAQPREYVLVRGIRR